MGQRLVCVSTLCLQAAAHHPPGVGWLVGWLVGSVGFGAAERDPQRWDADGPLIGQVLLRERFFPTLCFLLFFAPTSWYLVHFRTAMEQTDLSPMVHCCVSLAQPSVPGQK